MRTHKPGSLLGQRGCDLALGLQEGAAEALVVGAEQWWPEAPGMVA